MLSYLFLVRKYLNKNKIDKFKIILETFKKNTAAAILSSALSREVALDQPMIFFPADHLIGKNKQFNIISTSTSGNIQFISVIDNHLGILEIEDMDMILFEKYIYCIKFI